jgi:cellulose biosynthesis protein BcsQ
MILANVAWILASNGKRVLVVDWDLEAPGLHRYFHPFLLDKDLTFTEGLIDLLNDFTDAALTPADKTKDVPENWYEPYANILRYAVSLNWTFPKKGAIDFVPAGKQGKLYATRVNSFNWDLFYERFKGGIFLEKVKEKMRAEYDYILIDSRTGISDTSGICTVQMPDILVIICSANEQSIIGAAGIANSVYEQWQTDDNRSYQDNWLIYPVLARTDRTEKDKLDIARNYVKSKFAPFLQHLSEVECEEYWGNVEIPYIPWYAYEEVLVTFRDNPYERASLLAAIEQLVSYLTNKEVTDLVAPSRVQRENILFQFARLFPAPSEASDKEALRNGAGFPRSMRANIDLPEIFVSYARVDNEPLAEMDKGWVTTLINELKNLLGKKLGTAYSLWMDYDLRGNQSVSPAIAEQLEKTAILLVILSPGYLASTWCRWELSTFLTKVGKGSGRVFVVEREEVQKPAELMDLISSKFWVREATGHSRILAMPKPTELEYYQKLDDLVRQLRNKIKSLTEEQAEKALSPAEAARIPTIFLAHVSDDLEERREAVKRYLEQQGVRVLPDKAYSYANIQQHLAQDLSQCRLFVQLLSDKISHGLPQLQYEQARAANLPILQWRELALDLNSVSDLAHRALLSQSTVMASSLVRFQTYITNRLKSTETENIEQTTKAPVVFINAVNEDRSLAHQMGNILTTEGIACSLPLEISTRTKPVEIQTNLQQNLLACDAVIVLSGDNTTVDWVKEQVSYCQRLQVRRKQPFKILAVCEKPAVDKPPVFMPQLRVFKCPTLQAETCLPEFIRILRT